MKVALPKDRRTDRRERDVGYGKPPKEHQFKPGQSGNPKGRPRGAKSSAAIVRELMLRKIEVRERGVIRNVSMFEAMLLRIFENGLKGDPKAAGFLLKLYDQINITERRPRTTFRARSKDSGRIQEEHSQEKGKTVMQNEQEILDILTRRNPEVFLRRALATVNPGADFLPNWHIKAIIYQLQRVERGEITRLIINLPPRSLKSLMVTVAWTAFLLGHQPSRRIFTMSYGGELSAKHTADFRSMIETAWFRRAFPNFQVRRNVDDEVLTTARGFRKSTSIYGTLTGLGGDLFILDDPQKPIDAQSEIQRNNLNNFFSNTLLSRLDNKETGAIVVVMQRVHLHDLSGFLTSQSDEWTVLSLPAIAEVDQNIPIGPDEFYYRRAGEPLHAEREPLSALEKIRQTLGSDIFAAQYQQSPVPPGGGMIKRAWFRYYDKLPERDYRTKVIISVDTAAKDGAQNDWSVFTTWLLVDKHYYLMDLTRGRYEYPQLKATAIRLVQTYRPDVFLIEDASTGTALAQELKSVNWQTAIRLEPVCRDKRGRLYVHQATFETGRVLFERGAPYLPELEAELLTFPQGNHDDQVDSITQALSYDGLAYTLDYVR